jgi:ferredoxin
VTTLRITVDPGVCRLNGRCLEAAPDVFRLGDDDAIDYDTEVGADLAEAVRDAEYLCPMQAIEVAEVADVAG